MAQYTLTLSWDAPTGRFQSVPPGGTAAFGWMWHFIDSHGNPQSFQMELGMVWPDADGVDPITEYQAYEVDLGFAFQSPWKLYYFSNDTAGGILTYAPSGNAGAFFLSSGTWSVTVDDTLSTFHVVGPMGTFNRTFGDFGIPNGSIAGLQLDALVMGLDVGNDPIGAPFNWDLKIGFYNFFSGTGHDFTQGGELGTEAPMSWGSGDFGIVPWTTQANAQTSEPGITTFTATRTRDRLFGEVQFDTAASPGAVGLLDATIAALHPGTYTPELLLALECEPQSGALVYARAIPALSAHLEIGTSIDRGHSWQTTLIDAGAQAVVQSPSLSHLPQGSILLAFHDGKTGVQLWTSDTNGQTWVFAGLLIPVLPWLTQSHPAVFTAANGFVLIAYNVANVWFLATYTGSGGGASIIQATSFGLNPGSVDSYATFSEIADGTLIAQRTVGSNESLFESSNYGVTWSNLYSAAVTHHQVRQASSPFSPFVWRVWQDGSNNLIGGAYQDHGLTVLPPGEQPIDFSFLGSIPAQYVGLTVLPDGTAIEVHQLSLGAVAGNHSGTLGANWSPN